MNSMEMVTPIPKYRFSSMNVHLCRPIISIETSIFTFYEFSIIFAVLKLLLLREIPSHSIS